MNSEFEIVPITGLAFRKVKFYTVKNADSTSSEFKLFLDKVKNYGNCNEDLRHIMASVKKIGEKFGADERRFKKESKAFALPAFYPQDIEQKRTDYGLRLYCIIITESIVILLNGGLKIETTAQKCANCSIAFHHANFLSKIIKDYVSDRTIEICGKELKINETLYY